MTHLALLEDFGLNIPSIWEDYYGAAIRSRTQILKDEGALGNTAKASLHSTSAKFRHWPLDLAFQSDRDSIPICSSVVARNMVTLLMVDLHPVRVPEIWSGNQISTSIPSRILIHLDEDGCPREVQPFPHPTLLIRKLAPPMGTWVPYLGPGFVSRPKRSPVLHGRKGVTMG
jgi:hypothetical protein